MDTLLETFGIAMAPVGAGILVAIIVAYRHPQSLARRLNRWLSLVALGALTFGCMAFFQTETGTLADATLGGDVGTAVIGSQNALGVLRLIGIGVAVVYLFTPRISWRVTVTVMALLGVTVTTSGRLLGASVVRIRDWYDMRRTRNLIKHLSKFHGPFGSRFFGRGPKLSKDPDYSAIKYVMGANETLVGTNSGIAVVEVEDPSKDEELEPQEEEPPALKEASPASQVWNMLAASEKPGSKLPSTDILETTTEMELTPVDNQRRAEQIEEALASHGIEAKISQINPGPTVTQFGVEPGWFRKYKEVRERDENGRFKLDENNEPIIRLEEVSRKRVRVDQILALDKDLALALAASSIRIEAPVPGKSLVGIEVPNSSMSLVGLREALEGQEFRKGLAKSNLALALGKGSAGQMVVGSLAGMPHLLIAGATGSGKSVCITSLISCILMHNAPEDVRFVLIDPKRVELASFSTLPHLITPVIVDMEKVVGALKWVSQEMDHRYKLMASAAARNISGYNQKVSAGEKIPYLVVVIDELADLMTMAPFEVEQSLTRLAQMGRATGIHLIVATQRPSVNVITGLIKANFPTRISFAVTSMMDSRVILDTPGAEKLLGRGDMLYLPSDASKPRRLQGVYVSEQEVERIVYFWSHRRGGAPSLPTIEELQSSPPDRGSSNGPVGASLSERPSPVASSTLNEVHSNEDRMFVKARALSLSYKSISASLLQRRLGIGYPKAAKLLDQLEEQGIVEPGEPGKSRKVLKSRMDEEDFG
ncbi:MAG: DNA translocase FtsK [Chloroflexi bacterium]|nr:DNA translocase FtsK [Chloroflexota bacterium]